MVDRLDEVDDGLAARITFPVVSKPLNRQGGFGVFKLNTPVEVRNLLVRNSSTLRLPILLQEWIDGWDFDISILSTRGRVAAWIGQCRKYGDRIEFIRHDPCLREIQRLSEEIGFSGVANIDVRVETSSNRFYILECNPRFWETTPISAWCGRNFVEMGLDLLKSPTLSFPNTEIGMIYVPNSVIAKLCFKPWRYPRLLQVSGQNWAGFRQALFDPEVRLFGLINLIKRKLHF